MSKELLPCPFCNGNVQRKIGYMGLNFFKCEKCGAVVSFDNDYCNREPDKAIEQFNSRACGKD